MPYPGLPFTAWNLMIHKLKANDEFLYLFWGVRHVVFLFWPLFLCAQCQRGTPLREDTKNDGAGSPCDVEVTGK
jgi:hypothetical protein